MVIRTTLERAPEVIQPERRLRLGRLRHSAPGESHATQKRLKKLAIRSFWMLAFIGIWQLIMTLGLIRAVLVASPVTVVKEFGTLANSGVLGSDIYWTLRRLIIGFAIGAAVGLSLGYLMATVRWIADALDWPIQALRSISPLALVPLTVLWFGLGEEQKYVIIALTVVFPILINAEATMRDLPSLFLDAAQCLGCLGRFRTFRDVVLPASLPRLVDACRVGLGIGFLVIIAAEMIGASRGLGYLVFNAGQEFDTADMFVGIVTIGILGVLFDRFLLLFKRLVAPWHVDGRGLT